MVEVESNDHYNGYYIWETKDSINNQSSIASKYRRMRKSLLDKLETLEPKVALALIDAEYTEYDDLLKSNYPEIYEQLYNNQLFGKDNIKFNIYKKEELLIASYLVFHAKIYKEKLILINLLKDNTEPNQSTSELQIGDYDNNTKGEKVLADRMNNLKIDQPPTKKLLTLEEVGMLFTIMKNNGYINDMSASSYGDIGYLLIGGSPDKIRKSVGDVQLCKLSDKINSRGSKIHLERILSFLNVLKANIEKLKVKKKEV